MIFDCSNKYFQVFQSKLYVLSNLWSKIQKMQLIFSIDL